MKKNIIKLDFGKTLTKIAGFRYGKVIYDKQASKLVCNEGGNIIEFPEQIDFVAPSFIQGFIAELLREVGVDNILEHIRFESPHPEVVKRIYTDWRMAM